MRARLYAVAAALCFVAGASWCGGAPGPVSDTDVAVGATFVGLGIVLLVVGGTTAPPRAAPGAPRRRAHAAEVPLEEHHRRRWREVTTAAMAGGVAGVVFLGVLWCLGRLLGLA